MRQLTNFRKFETAAAALMAMTMLIFISACGGGGSSGSDETISGYVFNGPIVGAEIKIFDNDNRLLDVTVSDRNGFYQIERTSLSGYIVTAAGGKLYGAEYSGTLKASCSSSSCNLTPLSTIIVDYAEVQGISHPVSENQVMSWLGVDEDPFISASQGRGIPLNLDLAGIRNDIIEKGLDNWSSDLRQTIIDRKTPAGWPGFFMTEEYNKNNSYKPNSLVSFKDNIYTNNWWANPQECPVEEECPSHFQSNQWKIHDPDVKHEFAYYDYLETMKNYPEVQTCTANDYRKETIKTRINQRIDIGDLARAAPGNGFTEEDREALYREYMLPCAPDLNEFRPENVNTVENILTRDGLWKELSSNIYRGDGSREYPESSDVKKSWPADDGFKDNAYENFLYAVARYPYFCGEQGYFDSVAEACKRELASLFAHAAQETGNTKIRESFYWLREEGYVNKLDVSKFKDGCDSPFDCSHSWAIHYGRGPKQLSYYYNYAGFSAAFFNGEYNFLLKWPDMVAYDGILYFQSAIWFVMTHQPPKPSIHDIMLGRYRPDAACDGGEDCSGLAHDPESGVKHNFNVTIDVVNGGPECRGDNKQQSKNRSDAYYEMLDLMKAELTYDEKPGNRVDGCDFISISEGALFANPKLSPGLRTWLDMSQTSCQAVSYGGLSMISVTAPGIVEACTKPR